MSVHILASFLVLHHSWLFILPSDDSCGGGLGTRLYVCMWYIMDIYRYNIHLASWHSLMHTSKSITAYSCVLYHCKTKTSLHTIVYCCILMYTIVYYWIVWINEHYSILLYTSRYTDIMSALTVPSLQAVPRASPLGKNLTALTSLSWMSNLITHWPLRASHTRAVRSQPWRRGQGRYTSQTQWSYCCKQSGS